MLPKMKACALLFALSLVGCSDTSSQTKGPSSRIAIESSSFFFNGQWRVLDSCRTHTLGIAYPTSYDFSGEIGGLSFSGSCSPSSCEPVQAGEYTVTPGIGYLEVHGKEMLPVNVTIESTTFGTGQISITEWGNDDAILLSPGN